MFSHVTLHARLEEAAIRSPNLAIDRASRGKGLSITAYRGLLRQLRNWIAGLQPLESGKTIWQDYDHTNNYVHDEARQKAEFVREFAAKVRPTMLFDIGCNTGDYTLAALDGGAQYVVGFDFDHYATEAAYRRASDQDLPFLPLWLDAGNQSPNQGWNECERPGFRARAKADAILALAFIHHLAIGKNIPLPSAIDWLIEIAPAGVIEFVPQDDSTVKEMLALRTDIFDGYTLANFETLLMSRASVKRSRIVSKSGRKLYWYERSH